MEFQEHLNSLKINLEDGSSRCMVERRGRDISGKWIYLCYPCAAVCSGETILQVRSISILQYIIRLLSGHALLRPFFLYFNLCLYFNAQTHLSGKKHKTKLTMRKVWPLNIFADHPFNHNTGKPVRKYPNIISSIVFFKSFK